MTELFEFAEGWNLKAKKLATIYAILAAALYAINVPKNR